jgi:anti-anti-sigma regulatory factor
VRKATVRTDNRKAMDSAHARFSGRSNIVIRLAEKLDLSTANVVRAQLRNVERACEIDLSRVRSIDTAGMTELAALARRLGPRSVRLRGASAQFRHVLERAGLQALFDLSPAP